jgi:hypothetical protein
MEHKIDQNKIPRLTFPKGRVFIFIDETGDPGHPSNKSSSRYFQLNMTLIHRDSLHHLNRHLSAFRYFKNSGKELKRHVRDFKILVEVLIDLAYKHNVLFMSFLLEKEKYVENDTLNFTPNDIRNFMLKNSLEYIFSEIVYINSELNNIELVFDRYLESESDELNLKRYLRRNNLLPKLEKITQVDSEYSDSVQVSDYIGKFVKECYIDKINQVNPYDFIKVFDLKNGIFIKTKSAQDTQ